MKVVILILALCVLAAAQVTGVQVNGVMVQGGPFALYNAALSAINVDGSRTGCEPSQRRCSH